VVESGFRRIKLEYLKHCFSTVAKINERKEYEIIPSRICERGDSVWVLEDEKFIRVTIF
jgi:hypothetical protein